MTDAELRDAALEEFKQTTVGYLNKHWTTPPAGTHWDKGISLLNQIGQTPPPPPPPKQILGIYDAPEANSADYSADWDAILAALPGVSFMMAPLNSSVIQHIGTSVQWCLVPSGITEAEFVQYGVPCWLTGELEGFVVVDEPGSDPASVVLISTICGWVKKYCYGTNKRQETV